jgi:hypothetical protein
MAQPARRPAAPEKYGEVLANVEAVEAQLKKLRETLDSGKALKYREVEAIGSAVASLVSRAASACW